MTSADDLLPDDLLAQGHYVAAATAYAAAIAADPTIAAGSPELQNAVCSLLQTIGKSYLKRFF
jgi:hypothetical protein